MNSIHIDLAPQSGKIATKAAELLERNLTDRSSAIIASDAELFLRLNIKEGIGVEGFRIDDAEPTEHRREIVITGNDERGLLYGVGKFLRQARYDDGFIPGDWRGVSVPEKGVRGMYFATHFHNFYHDAPIEQVQRYIEELALWGCNTLAVWFDMHHYRDLHEPAAQAFIARLHEILHVANEVGIGAALIALGNEAYADSPLEMRAEGEAELGIYGVELCPNKPGAMELMLRWRREVLEAFADINVEYVLIWPYDQGGCNCEACRPWGANGFLKMTQAVGHLTNEIFPHAKNIVSTWCFDYNKTGEYEGMWRVLETRPDWADYVMTDAHGAFPSYPQEHGIPGGMPMLNFPEISMQQMFPWGGFGANPLPAFFQNTWENCGHLMSGGFPYSEGIYEDMTKAVALQFYWDAKKLAIETVREYAAYEFCTVVADDVVRIIETLEATQKHYVNVQLASNLWHADAPALDTESEDAVLYSLALINEPERLCELVQDVESKLPSWASNAWRWRIIALRVALERELHHSDGCATQKSDSLFEELNQIYNAENADFSVATPSRRALKRLCKG
ncbi:MAG: hypothetical protein ABI210_05900 [Abditibacteriaceae bacterium]